MNLPTCCMDLDVAIEHLVLPAGMDDAGREFYLAHGLGSMTLGELQSRVIDLGLVHGVRTVKIWHRCQHLTDQGLCDIYASRPKICRDFKCKDRTDCACKGRGVTPAAAVQLALAETDLASTLAERQP